MTFPDYGIPYPVLRTATPQDHAGLALCFERGHYLARGVRAGSRVLLETALGIIGVENADGRAIIQNNFGNLSVSLAHYTGPFWVSPVAQPDQPIAFQAFETAFDGAAAWWRLMYRRFLPVLDAAAGGDTARMVRELYRLHYVVGGRESDYRTGAATCSARYRAEGIFAGFYRSDVAAAAMAAASVVGLAAFGVCCAG